jgi:hypothetical protein
MRTDQQGQIPHLSANKILPNKYHPTKKAGINPAILCYCWKASLLRTIRRIWDDVKLA